MLLVNKHQYFIFQVKLLSVVYSPTSLPEKAVIHSLSEKVRITEGKVKVSSLLTSQRHAYTIWIAYNSISIYVINVLFETWPSQYILNPVPGEMTRVLALPTINKTGLLK